MRETGNPARLPVRLNQPDRKSGCSGERLVLAALAAGFRRPLGVVLEVAAGMLPALVAGLAAYDAWADGLLIDEDFPADDREILDIRTVVYGDQVCMVHDRAFGAQFLADCVPIAPEAAEELKAAALTLARVPATPDLYPWQAMPQSELVRQSLASREVREDLVPRIRAARDWEAQALDHMAAALERLV